MSIFFCTFALAKVFETMAKRKEITIRSSAAEYLTFISAVGDQPESVELRYQDENIWLTQRLMAEKKLRYSMLLSPLSDNLTSYKSLS